MRTFGFREAAEFWEAAGDPELAFRLHALVGGAPEYKDLCGGAGPRPLTDFDDWVRQRLLNPASVMFRSGGLMLGEEAPTADLSSCVGVLGAIAAGAARPSEIAAALARPEGSVGDLLAALTGMGVIERLQDPLHGERSGFVIVKPIARLHQLVIAPYEAALAAGQADRVWALSRETVAGRIYRPHFASVARQWCLRHAAEETVGGVPPRPGRPRSPVASTARSTNWRPSSSRNRSPPAASSPSARPTRPAGRWTPGSCGGLSTCAPCCRANASGGRPGCCCSAGRGSRPD